MKNRSLISIDDYTREEYLEILRVAAEFEKNPVQNILEGVVVSTLFFEPSTRTRLSFESAVSRLGGKIIGFTDAASSSVKKGESLKDTILTVSNYSDLIVMRHPTQLHERRQHHLVVRSESGDFYVSLMKGSEEQQVSLVRSDPRTRCEPLSPLFCFPLYSIIETLSYYMSRFQEANNDYTDPYKTRDPGFLSA